MAKLSDIFQYILQSDRKQLVSLSEEMNFVDAFSHVMENLSVPKPWIERNYSLVQFSEMPYGGHFTAMEAPEPFALALREFITKLR